MYVFRLLSLEPIAGFIDSKTAAERLGSSKNPPTGKITEISHTVIDYEFLLLYFKVGQLPGLAESWFFLLERSENGEWGTLENGAAANILGSMSLCGYIRFRGFGSKLGPTDFYGCTFPWGVLLRAD